MNAAPVNGIALDLHQLDAPYARRLMASIDADGQRVPLVVVAERVVVDGDVAVAYQVANSRVDKGSLCRAARDSASAAFARANGTKTRLAMRPLPGSPRH